MWLWGANPGESVGRSRRHDGLHTLLTCMAFMARVVLTVLTACSEQHSHGTCNTQAWNTQNLHTQNTQHSHTQNTQHSHEWNTQNLHTWNIQHSRMKHAALTCMEHTTLMYGTHNTHSHRHSCMGHNTHIVCIPSNHSAPSGHLTVPPVLSL